MRYGIAQLSITPMRAEASDASEMTNQVLFGEHFKILEARKKSGVGFDYRMINMKVGFATSNGKKSIKLPTVSWIIKHPRSLPI